MLGQYKKFEVSTTLCSRKGCSSYPIQIIKLKSFGTTSLSRVRMIKTLIMNVMTNESNLIYVHILACCNELF